MTEPIKIGICGRARSGKDTAAGYLALFYDFRPFAFGDALRESLYFVFPHLPREPKPRAILQRFGQWMREIDENVWIDKTFNAVDRYAKRKGYDGEPAHIVITDIRQQNEYDRLRAEGYSIIRITASNEERVRRAIDNGDNFTVHDLVHPTEQIVDKFSVDFEITNNGDLESLETQIDDIMRELGVSKAN